MRERYIKDRLIAGAIIAALILIASLFQGCTESKARRIQKLNEHVKIESDYREALYKDAMSKWDDSAYYNRLKRKGDSSKIKIDSLQAEIKKVETE